jgi:3-oxoacyl-[acyl-carrier protein] reductase
MRLRGRVIFLTGGGGGVGRALARAFVQEGACVAVGDVRVEHADRVARESTAEGGDALPIAVDVTDPNQVRQAVARITATLGPIDVLVNNAGITDLEHRPVARLPLEVWARVLLVNLTGAVICTQTIIPAMIGRRRGNIINVTSFLGLWRSGVPGDAPYCASKAGLEALTDVLAKELRRHLINVNSLCPYTKLDTGFFAHVPPETRKDLDDPSVLCAPAVFLASLEPGTLTGLSVSDLWWRIKPAYREQLLTEHEVLAEARRSRDERRSQ